MTSATIPAARDFFGYQAESVVVVGHLGFDRIHPVNLILELTKMVVADTQ